MSGVFACLIKECRKGDDLENTSCDLMMVVLQNLPFSCLDAKYQSILDVSFLFYIK